MNSHRKAPRTAQEGLSAGKAYQKTPKAENRSERRRMRLTGLFINTLLLGLLFLVPSVSAAADLPYYHDFENASTFGWTFQDDGACAGICQATVDATKKISGVNSYRIRSSNPADRVISYLNISNISSGTVNFTTQFKLTMEDDGDSAYVCLGANNNVGGQTESCCAFFKDNTSIVQRGATDVDAGVTWSQNEVFNISLVVDVDAATYDLYINDSQVGTNDFACQAGTNYINYAVIADWNGGNDMDYAIVDNVNITYTPPVLGVNVTLELPTANDNTNDDPLTFTYNSSVTDGTADNCSLMLNGSINTTDNNVANGNNNFLVSMGEGAWTWTVNCSDSGESEQPAARTVTLDYTTPDWTLNASNFFNAANTTVWSVWRDGDNATFNLTVDDENGLYAFMVLIENQDNGTVMFNHTETGLVTLQEVFQNQTNMSAWRSGEYRVTLYAEDDHTARTIPSYATTSITEGRRWTTPDGLQLTITSSGATITTRKEPDRYTFTASYPADRTTTTYLVKSTEPLVYREHSRFPGHFVTGKHWLDFDTPGVTSTHVTDNGYHDGIYEYEVTLEGKNSAVWEYSSFGGLNIVNETYLFTINNTPRQSENLTADSEGYKWILLSWDDPAEASGSTLYNETGSVLYNQTNGTTSINLTGLQNSTTYNFYVLSFYNDTGVALYNESLSAENNITASTTFAGQIQVTLYDEDTLALITQNITIIFTSNDSESTYTTTTGSLNIGDLDNGSYIVAAGNNNYTQRSFNLTVAGGISTLNIYLVQNASTVLFTTIDANIPTIFIDDVLIEMYRYLNGTRTLVEIRTTDISGRSQFSFSTGKRYDFEVTKDGYDAKSFTLNPILFTSYDILLSSSSSYTPTHDYSAVTVTFNPHYYPADEALTFTLTVNSPTGRLDSYGYNFTYPGGSSTDSGTNNNGETFTTPFTITGAAWGDKVNITYYYDTDFDDEKTFRYTYLVQNVSTNLTFIQQRDNPYGLSVFEQTLIATVGTIAIGGMATFIAGAIIGGSVSLFVMGWFFYLGFLPLWSVIISIIVGAMIIMQRSS